MFRTRSYLFAALALAAATTVAPAQIPGSFSATPTSSITLQAQKPESFGMTMSSTVQTGPLTIADSTAGASQLYSGSVTLTPTWDLANSRTVQIYAYVQTQFATAGAVTFPNSVIEASASGGSGTANGSWNPFSSSVDGHASAVLLTSVSPAGATLKVTNSSQALTVNLRLNTTNTYIEPGLYTGVVTFAAHVQ